MRRINAALALLTLLYLCGGTARAQSTTGTIRGHVTDAQGLALPGVTISATSPNLQGVRSAVSAENGDYVLTSLPSGTYTLTFELSGFQRVQRTMGLAPTQDIPLEVELGPAAVSEEVNVVGTQRRRPHPDRAGRDQLQAGPDREPANQPRHQRLPAAGAGRPPHGTERRLLDCGGRVVRKSVPGERRHRQREPARAGERSLYRGCHPGNDCGDGWDFGRVQAASAGASSTSSPSLAETTTRDRSAKRCSTTDGGRLRRSRSAPLSPTRRTGNCG